MQSLILKIERSTGYICRLANTFAKCDVVMRLVGACPDGNGTALRFMSRNQHDTLTVLV
jgi:hypothetical protein